VVNGLVASSFFAFFSAFFAMVLFPPFLSALLPDDAGYYASCAPNLAANRKVVISLRNSEMRGCANADKAKKLSAGVDLINCR
jgi:hypothetical protein